MHFGGEGESLVINVEGRVDGFRWNSVEQRLYELVASGFTRLIFRMVDGPDAVPAAAWLDRPRNELRGYLERTGGSYVVERPAPGAPDS
jgi:hypothetical protein